MRRSPKTKRPLIERFWEKVAKGDGDDACWTWTAYRLPQGYGLIQRGRYEGGSARAHRVSWEIHFGPIPDGLWVLHRCDNPPCVRPGHLWLGTDADNKADMVRKGRAKGSHEILLGEANNNAILAANDVSDIRAQPLVHGARRRLARKYGVSPTTIYDILHLKTWRHLVEPAAVRRTK